MSTSRRASIAAALSAVAALLAAGPSSVMATAGGESGSRVVLRFAEDEKTNTAPISGTYTASGAITDRGTAVGTHFPVYGKVHGQQEVVGIQLVQKQTGKLGSFTLRCRDSHFDFNRTRDRVLRATGRCVITSATGAYARLRPLASTTLVPSHPRPGYTHTVRLVPVRTSTG